MIDNWAHLKRLCIRTEIFHSVVESYDSSSPTTVISEAMEKSINELLNTLQDIYDLVK